MLGPDLSAKLRPGPRPTTRYTSIPMEYTSNSLAFQANTNIINTNEQIKLSIRGVSREKTVDVNTEHFGTPNVR